MLTRHLLLGLLTAVTFGSAASAQDMPVFFATEGAAMAGYDPVSYFEGDVPQRGQPGIVVRWKGADWYFASQENRELFERDPRAFAPQFGGYCSYAMAQGVLKSTDPNAWQVIDGRLYLTHSLEIEQIWNQDQDGYIASAEDFWPAVLYNE